MYADRNPRSNYPGQGRDLDSLLLEVDRNDPRFTDNSDVKLADSSLGQFGQVMDSILNPLSGNNLSRKIYLSFLECSPDEMTEMTKTFAPYRSPLVRYALTKIKNYQFKKLSLENESGIQRLNGGDRNLEIVQTGTDSHIKIPRSFNYGVITKDGSRFCFRTIEDYGSFSLSFVYNGKNSKIEAALDKFLQDLEETMERFNYFRKGRITPRGEFLKISKKDWSDIELTDSIKRKIKQNIIDLIEKEELYRKNGISSKRGLLFAGKPGTGKTLVCKILASELKDFTFIWVTANDLTCAKDVELLYNMARELSPTIVLLEDADLFCTDRRSGSYHPVLGEILSQLDGLVELRNVVTIMTSNLPGALDKALLQRPGRFDLQIVFEPPEKDARIRLLSKALSKVKINKNDLNDIADDSDGLTGAQLKEIANLSIIYAIGDSSVDPTGKAIIKKEHLFQALESYKDKAALAPVSDSYLDSRDPELVEPEESQILNEQKISEQPRKPKQRSNILSAVNQLIPKGTVK